MRYLIKLKPLEPYFFGGDITYGKLGDEENGTYLVKSQHFPQQSAILGMLKKEIMIQDGVLTRKVRGEWVDKRDKQRAVELTGDEKFNIFTTAPQNFGVIKKIEPLFLLKKSDKYIKKVAIDDYEYKDGMLQNYTPKSDIYDNYIQTNNKEKLSSDAIFQKKEQTGNKIGGKENSLFKKTSYMLKDDFTFAFFAELDFELQNAIVKLGADGSKFKLEIAKSDDTLSHEDKNGYLTLLSDTYLTLPIKEHCDFAITSEIAQRSIINKKHVSKKSEFKKTKRAYLYEKGSVFINPSQELLENVNNKNLINIGYNTTNKEQK